MSSLAAIRPDDLNLLLFIHVLGAMVFVGALLLAGTVLAGAWNDGSAQRVRLGYRTLLIAVVPSYLVMRVFGQILESKDDYEAAEESAWIGIGYGTTELGLLLIIASSVAAGVGSRKALRDGGPVGTSGKVATVLVWIMVVLFTIAIWAMTAKPD
jgi:hypothetical protein